jgi:hypothetical protein
MYALFLLSDCMQMNINTIEINEVMRLPIGSPI